MEQPSAVDVICAERLAELWKDHATGLTLLCRGRCNAPDDCVQEAFIKLANQNEVPRDPVAWLATVARNLAISQTRSESRRREREIQAGTGKPNWFEPPQHDSLAAQHQANLQSALEQLDPTTREIVIAHVWTGLSFRQISDVLEISKSSAARQYQTGLAALKRALLSGETPDSPPTQRPFCESSHE